MYIVMVQGSDNSWTIDTLRDLRSLFLALDQGEIKCFFITNEQYLHEIS